MISTSESIAAAVAAIRQGGVIAYPTEAVWGLGCDPSNSAAVQRICSLKQRSPSKGVLLVGSNIEQVTPLLQSLNDKQQATILATWPGPVTWVLPNTMGFSDDITGGRDSVAVRISAHPVIKQLCDKFNGLIVSTSANLSGKPPAKTLESVQLTFSESLDYVLAIGSTEQNMAPSQIFDGRTGQRLR